MKTALLCLFLVAGAALGNANLIRTFVVPLSGVTRAQVADKNANGILYLSIFREEEGSYTLLFLFDTHSLTPRLPPLYQHIHFGNRTTSGPVVLLFPGDWTRYSSDHRRWILTGSIIDTNDYSYTQVIDAVLDNPSEYYINVHTPKYPNGAIRGQMA